MVQFLFILKNVFVCKLTLGQLCWEKDSKVSGRKLVKPNKFTPSFIDISCCLESNSQLKWISEEDCNSYFLRKWHLCLSGELSVLLWHICWLGLRMPRILFLETAFGGLYLKPPSLKSYIHPRGLVEGGGGRRRWHNYSQPKVCRNPISSGQECKEA